MGNQIHIKSSLLDAVKERRAVLFAGAGFSWKAIGFGAAHIREQIGFQITRDFPSYDFTTRSMEDVCDEFAAVKSKIELANVLGSLIPQDREPQESHIAAVKIFRFIITTNWDLLFEAAYRRIQQHYQVLSQESDAPMFNYDQHNLLKIHGSADHPLTLIATTEDFENYIDTHRSLLNKVEQLLENNTVVFVGYGLHDENIRHLLARIRRIRQNWTQKAFAVGRFDEVRTILLGTRGIETINADADEFLSELARQAAIV